MGFNSGFKGLNKGGGDGQNIGRNGGLKPEDKRPLGRITFI